MSNETLVSQVQKEPPVIPKPPVDTDYVDESWPNPRSLQSKHRSTIININHRQRKREEDTDEEGSSLYF